MFLANGYIKVQKTIWHSKETGALVSALLLPGCIIMRNSLDFSIPWLFHFSYGSKVERLDEVYKLTNPMFLLVNDWRGARREIEVDDL